MHAVTVFRTFNPAEAQLIASMLDASDLHPNVFHELSALSMDGYAMAAGGIEVQVPDTEADMARELIKTPTSDARIPET